MVRTIGNGIRPAHIPAGRDQLDSDVCEKAIGRRSMPIYLTCRNSYDIPPATGLEHPLPLFEHIPSLPLPAGSVQPGGYASGCGIPVRLLPWPHCKRYLHHPPAFEAIRYR
ncbi:MAG: hypothetical protein ABI416_01850 [Ginsengibacter sp.]